MPSAILLGCGAVGAGYDWDSEQVHTHAKALSHYNFSFSVFDEDTMLAERVAERYGARLLRRLDSFSGVDVVSIAAPTSTHCQYLTQCLDAKVPLILCEKPLVSSKSELGLITDAYNAGSSRVLINYIRRYQPAYQEAREQLPSEPPLHVSITYSKGFLNYASHAVDLLRFFFPDAPLRDAYRSWDSPGASEDDPSVCGGFHLGSAHVSLVGVPLTQYPLFKCEIFFSAATFSILSNGHHLVLEVGQAEEPLAPVWSSSTALENYMLPVYRRVLDMLQEPSAPDGFTEALELCDFLVNLSEL